MWDAVMLGLFSLQWGENARPAEAGGEGEVANPKLTKPGGKKMTKTKKATEEQAPRSRGKAEKQPPKAHKANGKASASTGVVQAKVKQPKSEAECETKEQADPKHAAESRNGSAKRMAKKEPKAKKEKPSINLEPLRKKVLEAEGEFTKARNDADALRMQARGVEEAAKKVYAEVLAPYREACRKAGVKCEFGGGKAGPVAPRVRFLVERVDKGIKVAIKDRPETEEVISDAMLKKSIGKAADAFVEKWVGSRQEIGNKAAGLGNRFRKVFRSE